VSLNVLSPIVGRAWLLTLQERAQGLTASNLLIPLHKATA
jgi:hypothetical protein